MYSPLAPAWLTDSGKHWFKSAMFDRPIITCLRFDFALNEMIHDRWLCDTCQEDDNEAEAQIGLWTLTSRISALELVLEHCRPAIGRKFTTAVATDVQSLNAKFPIRRFV